MFEVFFGVVGKGDVCFSFWWVYVDLVNLIVFGVVVVIVEVVYEVGFVVFVMIIICCDGKKVGVDDLVGGDFGGGGVGGVG